MPFLRLRRRRAAVSGGPFEGDMLCFWGPDHETPCALETAEHFRGEPFMSMRTRVLSQLTAGSLLLGAAIGAQAANLGFLNDTPISYMKQRDIDSVKKAVFAALERQAGRRNRQLGQRRHGQQREDRRDDHHRQHGQRRRSHLPRRRRRAECEGPIDEPASAVLQAGQRHLAIAEEALSMQALMAARAGWLPAQLERRACATALLDMVRR